MSRTQLLFWPARLQLFRRFRTISRALRAGGHLLRSPESARCLDFACERPRNGALPKRSAPRASLALQSRGPKRIGSPATHNASVVLKDAAGGRREFGNSPDEAARALLRRDVGDIAAAHFGFHPAGVQYANQYPVTSPVTRQPAHAVVERRLRGPIGVFAPPAVLAEPVMLVITTSFFPELSLTFSRSV